MTGITSLKDRIKDWKIICFDDTDSIICMWREISKHCFMKLWNIY